VVLLVVLVCLAASLRGGEVNLDAFRSQPNVLGSERLNAFYSCLTAQLQRLVTPGTEVSLHDWDTAGPLRVVVAADPEVKPVFRGHDLLLLVRSSQPAACEGYVIKAASPTEVVHFGTTSLVRSPERPSAGRTN